MIRSPHSRQPLVPTLALWAVFLATGLLQAAEPVLELPEAGGQVHKLDDYRGQVVVVNFWATWCGPCAAEMPVFVNAQKRFGKRGVVILAASLDSEETRANIPAFVKKFKIEFPILVGASFEHLAAFDLGEALPATVFIDAEGGVAFRISGQAHRKEVFERIEWMLGEGRSSEAPEPTLNNF